MILRIVIFALLFSFQSLALSPQSPFYIMRFYNHFISQGVPEKALNESLLFLMERWGTPLKTQLKNNKKINVKITNSRFLGIVDYNKSSLDKRFWILDLHTGKTESIWVSHGAKTGGVFAYQFSNVVNSWQTSLGFYLTGPNYIGKFGKSVRLYGLSTSNHLAFERDIVLHPAKYVSFKFALEHLRIGRSHGCLAVSYDDIETVLKKLPPGSLIYAFHDQLLDDSIKTEIPTQDNPTLTIEEETQRP